MAKFNYLVELAENTEAKSWIDAFRIGSWLHPQYGKIHGTMGMFEKVIANFKANVLGRVPVIDYNHSSDDDTVSPDERGLAAGWVKDMRIAGDRLQFFVEWTAAAIDKIKAGQFKYFSPTFTDTYVNKENGENVGTLMFGGALTNTPFLTGLSPVVLSEKFSTALLNAGDKDKTYTQILGENQMGKLAALTPEQLRVWCDAFDATEGDDATKASAAWTAIGVTPGAEEKVEESAPPEKKPDEEKEKMKGKLADLEKEKLALEEKLANQEIEKQLAELAKPGTTKLALPPVTLGKVKLILTAKPGAIIKLAEGKEYPTAAGAMIAMLSELRDIGLVAMGEETILPVDKPEDGITEADKRQYGDASDESIKVAKLTDKLYADAKDGKTYKVCMQEAYNMVHKEGN